MYQGGRFSAARGFCTFSNTMMLSCNNRCNPFSTKDTVGNIAGAALHKIVICLHLKEVMFVNI
jgi:hypothetical protein